MDKSKEEYQIMEAMAKRQIVKLGHWKLTSGKHSEYYIQKDMILQYPLLRRMILKSMLNKIIDLGIVPTDFDYVAGPAIAGAIYASMLGSAYNIPIIYPEKVDCKQVFRRGFNDLIQGKKLLLIEDIVTTGGSLKSLINAVRENGGDVLAAIVIWDRTGMLYDLEKVPIQAVVREKVESYNPEECKLCKYSEAISHK